MPKDANGRFGLFAALISLIMFVGAAEEPVLLFLSALWWGIAYGFHDLRRDQMRADEARRSLRY